MSTETISTEASSSSISTQAQHTPGPWAVNPVNAQVDAFEHGDPLPVCQLLWPTAERAEAATFANARLIAAAPELLDALEDAVAICALSAPDHNLAIARARAAIAKATGAAQ